MTSLPDGCTRCGESLPKRRSKFCSKLCSDRNWRDRNRDKVRAGNSKRAKEHPEWGRKAAANYRARHPEKDSTWKENNPDKVRTYYKTYRSKNPAKNREQARRRRARIRGSECLAYTEQDIIDAYGTNCYLCGEPVSMSAARGPGLPGWERGLHIDHVTPLAKGGPDTLANVRPSHGLCNLRKGASLVVPVIDT